MSMKKALIYCRVSSEKQVKEGNGLDSQEQRCRKYAEFYEFHVMEVFKEKGISGAVENRPAINSLLDYLAKQDEEYVVIADDIARLARDPVIHISLKKQIQDLGGKIVFVNMNFDDSPEGEYVEIIMSAGTQLDRKINARRTKNRMQAHGEQGYYVLNPPYGYKKARDANKKVIRVRDEPVASVIKEALERYAAGSLVTQADVGRFLNDHPDFKRKIYPQGVKRILSNPFYTGWFAYPKWNIPYQKWHIEPLIDVEIHERILERMNLKKRLPNRKDVREDFPLRGFVLCECCGNRLTASWSKGRNGKHPYYRCKNKKCDFGGKSIRKAQLEGDLEGILDEMTPQKPLLDLLKAIVKDVHQEKLKTRQNDRLSLKRAAESKEKQIETLFDRIVMTENPSMVSRYEKQIKTYESEKADLEKQLKGCDVDIDVETVLESASDFLSNPLKHWEEGGLDEKRQVLEMVFAENLTYHKEKGFGTAKKTLPFSILDAQKRGNLKVATPTGFEPVLPA